MPSCSTCSSTARPGDRFCASCGSQLEARCAACGTTLPEGARFCPACGLAQVQPGDAVPTKPDTVGQHHGTERRVVSVVFTDLVGFTASSDGVDPEDVRRRLQPFHTVVREEVERFGGRVEKLMGDGVLAVFGAPIAHEDDPERAVRAGLRIQAAISQIVHDDRLTARVAVGTGEVIAAIDPNFSDGEGLVGDVVNTASRLQQEAEPGTVIVDEATHRATQRSFRFEHRPPVAVKGKAKPLAVWIAVEPTGRYGVDVGDDTASRMIGRDSEVVLLAEAFGRAARDSTSQTVTIAGEAGVGKSRLVRELRHHVDDLPDLVRWRQGRCLPYGEGVTFWALGEIIKAEAGILETDTPATALGKVSASLENLDLEESDRIWISSRLAPLIGSEPDAATDRSERFAAWHRYLTALAEQRPTVIVIEDLHWADSSLVEFLGDLADAARHVPLLLVATTRPTFFETHQRWAGGQRNSVMIRLEPLDPANTLELIDELLSDDSLTDDVRRVIAERSGGNPLYAQEFARMVRDQGAVSDDLALPETVQSIVAARLDLLEPETKTLLQAASVVGKSFWSGAVAAVLESDVDVDGVLSDVVRRELIRRERSSTMAHQTEYAFTHSVIRDVAYSQAPRAVRAGRHHRIARWLETVAGDRLADRAEVIAHHDSKALELARATDQSESKQYTETAIASHLRAGVQAASLDLVAERTHLEAALDLMPDDDPRKASALESLGMALSGLGDVDLAVKRLAEAVEAYSAISDDEGWARTSVLLGRNYWIQGDSEASLHHTDMAIERLAGLPASNALASAYSHRAGALWLRGDVGEEALAYIDGIRSYVQQHGDSESRARLLSAEGGILFDGGDPAAIDSFREVLRMAVDGAGGMNLGSAHLNLGEQLRTGWGTDEADRVVLRGLEIARKRGIHGASSFLRAVHMNSLFIQGRWNDAMAVHEEAMAAPSNLNYVQYQFRGLMLKIEAGRGDRPVALESRIRDLVAEAESLRDLQATIPTYEVAAWAHLLCGDEDNALKFSRRVVEASGATRYLFDSLTVPLYVMRRAGELAPIVELIGGLRRFDMPRPRALLKVIEALDREADDPSRSLTDLEAAASSLVDFRVELDAVFALAEAARIAATIGNTDAIARARARARGLMSGERADHLLSLLGAG